MGLLPENKPKEFNRTPRITYIWGDSMTGKTFLATKFPNPLLINTDGNAEKISTPSIQIKTWVELVNVLKEIEQMNHTFETIIFDLAEDIKMFLDDYIISEYNKTKKKDDAEATSLSDLPFGKGFSTSAGHWKQFIMRVTMLNLNIIFISHSKLTANEGVTEPALEKKYANVLQGRCDLEIKTFKIGLKYSSRVEKRRLIYSVEDFKDTRIFEALKDVEGILGTGIPEVKIIKEVKKEIVPSDFKIETDEPIDVPAKVTKELKKI